jgi:four helix bundle protein
MDADHLRARTARFALQVVRFCRHLPRTWEARRIGEQLFDSGTSVGANYRAACRARSRAEFIAKLGVVVEEADETVFWLVLLGQAGITKTQESQELLAEAHELVAIFAASQKTARDNRERELAQSPNKSAITRS